MSNDLAALPADLASINNQEPSAALESILRHTLERRASDLFLQASPVHYTVSIRRLGTIERMVILSKALGTQVLHLIKSTAGMDLAERRHPLDGRWSHPWGDSAVDFRVNSIGTLHGEDLALRVFPPRKACMPLAELGFVGNQFSDLRSMLGSASGLLLVTGPTGAGKSTTLYGCLEYLNNGKRMINTLEDPVEYVLDGVRQCQIQVKAGIGFSELLRGILRQSPDVIMIGEIRDEETAHTVVRAANSGQLVLSTLHSPYAADAVQSMLAYGIKPYFLSNSLLGVVSQRLVRTLSPRTRKPYDISHSPQTFDEVRQYLEPDQGNVIYGPDENDATSQSGYTGQTGLFEVLTIDQPMRELVAEGASAGELHASALKQGMLDFRRAALIKTAQGITSIEEMSRVIPTGEVRHDS
jgi:type II secretory ATPase GspE/PulE/Tfp pilus assembly ATPase PilB-like protein